MIDQHNEITAVIKFFEDEADLCFKVPGNMISELFYQHYVKHCLFSHMTEIFTLCHCCLVAPLDVCICVTNSLSLLHYQYYVNIPAIYILYNSYTANLNC